MNNAETMKHARAALGKTAADVAVDATVEKLGNALEGPHAGMVVHADWAGGDRAKMRLVELVRHPAGDCWAVNVYDHHAGRYSKTIQHVSVDGISAAIARAEGGAA